MKKEKRRIQTILNPDLRVNRIEAKEGRKRKRERENKKNSNRPERRNWKQSGKKVGDRYNEIERDGK